VRAVRREPGRSISLERFGSSPRSLPEPGIGKTHHRGQGPVCAPRNEGSRRAGRPCQRVTAHEPAAGQRGTARGSIPAPRRLARLAAATPSCARSSTLFVHDGDQFLGRHRQDHFWKAEAMKKLPQLKQATNMLVCGEDLGMVPHCVPDVMKQLGILSLEIQRMPKDPKREFFHPADAPYLSVVTPSTHDMSTIRGWWEEDRSKTQRFFNHELGQWGDAPFYCEPWINKSIVLQHLPSPAMWSIFQLQDLLGMSESIRRENPHDERINVPANPKNYWKFRMHISLENLLKEKEFNEEFRSYVHASDR